MQNKKNGALTAHGAIKTPESEYQNGKELSIEIFTEKELAYTAGIIDGEGCIGIYKRLRGKGKNPQYYPRVTVKMTDSKVILYLYRLFGGNWHYVKPKGNRKNQYEWQLGHQKAANFLYSISPYLITKEIQAILAFQFQENLVRKNSNKDKLSESVIEAKEKLANEFRILNQRGGEKYE